jgi:hypothetical protein
MQKSEPNLAFGMGIFMEKNVEIVSEKKLAQEWFAGDWAEP